MLVVAALVLLVILIYISTIPGIPPYVQFQSSYSRKQAEFFCAKASYELRKAYWSRICDQLRDRRLSDAWKRLRNGPGTVYGVVTDLNSNVVAFVKLRNGEGFWITVVEHKGSADKFAGIDR